MPWPEYVSHEYMQSRLKIPITRAVVMVLLGSPKGGRIYARDEDGRWRLLDDKVYKRPGVPIHE